MMLRRGVLHNASRLRAIRPYSTRMVPQNSGFLKVSEEVREALHAGRPVVALETTIYTHGFPYPDNVALASELESIVRVNGGVPATIGIVDGIAQVGMDPEDLIRLAASASQADTLKISRRDLAYACGMRLAGKQYMGGTTIAGTMLLAHLAGIKVFATGGLGGVHRGAESSMDISADLTELGRTPVAVVSSGCKSFLDLPRTLEYLETQGVCVATFADGRSGKVNFPAFWTRDSGVKSPLTVSSEQEAAAMIYAQLSLPVRSGMLFANPIPESAELPKSQNDKLVDEAIKQAAAAGIQGKDNTPYVLNKMKELSGKQTVVANRALVAANVRRGALVARELAILESSNPSSSQSGEYTSFASSAAQLDVSNQNAPSSAARTTPTNLGPAVVDEASAAKPVDVIVAGSLAVDFACDFSPFTKSDTQTQPQLHTSNPARISQTLGGVGYNVAKAAHLMGARVQLRSVVADDLSGQAAMARLKRDGKDIDGVKVIRPSKKGEDIRTAQYVAVNDADKGLHLAMADMSIIETITPDMVDTTWSTCSSASSTAKWLVADGNWTAPTLRKWLEYGKSIHARTIFEPVSTAKATRLLLSSSSSPSSSTSPSSISPSSIPLPTFPTPLIDIITPNTHELSALHSTAHSHGLFDPHTSPTWWPIIDALGIPSSGIRTRLAMNTSHALVDQGVPQMSIRLLPFMPVVITTLGSEGVLLTMILGRGDERLRRGEDSEFVMSRADALPASASFDSDSSASASSSVDTAAAAAAVGGLYMRLFPPPRVLGPGQIVSVNGAGDSFLGALVAELARGCAIEEAIETAQRASLLTLQSGEAVSGEIAGMALAGRMS